MPPMLMFKSGVRMDDGVSLWGLGQWEVVGQIGREDSHSTGKAEIASAIVTSATRRHTRPYDSPIPVLRMAAALVVVDACSALSDEDMWELQCAFAAGSRLDQWSASEWVRVPGSRGVGSGGRGGGVGVLLIASLMKNAGVFCRGTMCR